MTRKRFHGLKKIRVRQTWNKYNLYNLQRLRNQNTLVSTFFQQKWEAKSLSRGYHGEHIKEGKWTRMFSRYVPAVVPMDPRYLAEFDGSDEASGRGQGRDEGQNNARSKRPKVTPYANMTFWMTERRLDTAIWRAMFASSARQARQFVVHGHVKVNGKKMKHPSYLLNPGDMFSVDVDRVLYATGAPKVMEGEQEESQNVDDEASASANEAEREEVNDEVFEEEEEDEAEEAELQANSEGEHSELKSALKKLRTQTQSIEENTDNLSGKRKQELRSVRKEARTLLSKLSTVTADGISELQSRLDETMSKISSSIWQEQQQQQQQQQQPEPSRSNTTTTASSHLARLSLQPNPVDAEKPYATPWRPRDWMSPFAFVPRYLEVNHTICSAVYLRHPVARPGLAEVPSPFNITTGTLAWAWYLRRR